MAAAAALSSPPNPNDSLGAFVHTDPDTGLQTFDSDAWTTAASTSGNWTSGNWTSGNWTSGNWTSGNWTSGNWTSGNWVD